MSSVRVPTAQGKQGKWQKKSLSGKTQGIWKFCQNTGKTQGIWFAQVVNSLILKVKDTSIVAAKITNFFLKLDKSASQFCICNSHKSRELAQGKFAVWLGGKTGKTQGIWKWKWSGYPASAQVPYAPKHEPPSSEICNPCEEVSSRVYRCPLFQ